MRASPLIALLLVIAVLPIDAHSQVDSDYTRATLTGLSGVGIVVYLTGDAPSGISETMLQTAAELRLRFSGIRVLSRDEMLKTPGYPNINLTVRMMSPKTQGGTTLGYVYDALLYLTQGVQLDRDPSIGIASGVTWMGKSLLGVVPNDAAARVIREVLDTVIDEFLNAYLAANPRN